MNEATVLEIGRNTMQIALTLTLPLLLVSLAIGLVIGILQAATQIHEQTISFVPKLLALIATMAILGPWMLQSMVRFTADILMRLPDLTR